MSKHIHQNPYYYDDLIDFRQVVRVLLKYKWIIIGATLIAALGIFIPNKFVFPSTYKATALVGVTQSVFEVDLQPNINNQSPIDDYRQLTELTKSLPSLAEADDVWQTVCDDMGTMCQEYGITNSNLEAVLIGTRQLELSVSTNDPDLSAEFANLWAAEVIRRWELLYGIDYIDLGELESEILVALGNWNTTQEELEKYLPESKLDIIEVQLDQAKQNYDWYLDEIEINNRIIRDVNSLNSRLEQQDQSSRFLIGDALSLVGLLQEISGEVSGTQFQISGTNIYGEGFLVEDARRTLTDLTSELIIQNEELINQLASLENEITRLALEQENEHYNITLLEQERDRARNYYQTLTGYYDETMITDKHSTRVAYCIAKAKTPLNAESNTLIYTLIAGLIGFIFSATGFYVYEWWRTPQSD